MICPGFAFSKKEFEWQSKEVQAVALYANFNKIPFKFFENPSEVPKDWIPVGPVDWCEEILGYTVKPNYYPSFLKDYLFRKVIETNYIVNPCFVKPADKHKRFNGVKFPIEETDLSEEDLKLYSPPYYCSELVSFDCEWRCYIHKGMIIRCYQYKGMEELHINMPDLPIPNDWYGTLDFGLMFDPQRQLRFGLVEAHPPYAIGWYGNMSLTNISSYVSLLVEGWNWIKNGNWEKFR